MRELSDHTRTNVEESKGGEKYEKPLGILFSRNQPETDDVQLVLLNCAQSVINLSESVFKDYQWKEEYHGENIYNMLSHLPINKTLVAVVGVRKGEQNLKEIGEFIKRMRRQVSQLHMIVCSDLSKSNPEIAFFKMIDPEIFIISEVDLGVDPNNLRKKFEAFSDQKTDKYLEIDDLTILDLLNTTEAFKVFGLPFEPFIDISKLKQERELLSKDDYSLWFDIKLYNDLIAKLKGNFGLAKLDFLVNLINDFPNYERLSYTANYYTPKKRYRDHFLHPMRIAVLGDFFLNVYIDENTKLIDLVNRNLRDQDAINIFPLFKNGDPQSTLIGCRLIWWVMALMHDCTYPLNPVFSPFLFDSEGKERMLKTYAPFFIQPYIDGHQMGDEILKHAFKKELRKFLRKVKIHDPERQLILNSESPHLIHNLTSAYNLWWMYIQQPKKDKRFCVELAAQSILLHHPTAGSCIDESERIRFSKYPLAFLLILLDEIQDWGRPAIITINQFNPTLMNKSIDLGKIKIEGITRVLGEPHKWKFTGETLIFTLDFEKNDNIEESAIENIINAKMENLGRLYIGSDPLPDIEVHLKFKGSKLVKIPIKRRNE